MADSEQRKRQIMEHLKRTTQLPQQLSATTTSSDARKRQIMDHLKMTRG